jgi:hypothetical protein
MKAFTNISLIVSILLCACSDEAEVIDDLLIGKWKLTEIFDGYANGGTFRWNEVPGIYTEIIEFGSNREYLESIDDNQQQQQCTGEYRILSETLLELSSSCQTEAIQIQINKINRTTLLLYSQGREGVLRYKYTLIQ